MNSHEAKQARRKQRLLEAADKQDEKANEAYARSDLSESASGIPLGQPILVGHHSEGRHRRAIAKAGRAMEQSIERSKQAKALRTKAEGVGQGGVSSDDPDAIEKLRAKLAELTISQDNMKTANRVIRKWLKKGVHRDAEGENVDHYLIEMSAIADHFTESMSRSLIDPDHSGVVGFASYQLTNNNAKIKTTSDRIKRLEKEAEQETKHHIFPGICEVIENTEENRIQFKFDGKPSAEIRKTLKSHGFRWAPSQDAWQRQTTNNARYSAKLVLKALGVGNDGPVT